MNEFPFRVLQINDPHVSDQPPRMRTDVYREHILAKLQAAMDLVHPRLVHHVVITGDLFHRTQAGHTSHATVQALRKILNSAGVPVSLVAGNHDRARGGALEGQPLLSVLGDNVTLLEGPHPQANIAGFGWHNALAGTEAEIEAYLAQGAWNAEKALVFVHAPIVPEPFPFGPEPAGWITMGRVAEHLNKATHYLGHGHIHNGHQPEGVIVGSYQGPFGGCIFGNPGALARATIAGDDRNRVPKVALITYTDQLTEVDYIELPYVPVEEAFLLAEHARDEERGDNIKALALSLMEGTMHVVTPDALVDAIKALQVPEGVLDHLFIRAQVIAIEAVEEASR